MGILVVAGTKKGVALLESEGPGAPWRSRFDVPGWAVTASTQDETGRVFIAVVSEAYGASVMMADGPAGGPWRQTGGAPRYAPGTPGNAVHNTIIQADLPLGSP